MGDVGHSLDRFDERTNRGTRIIAGVNAHKVSWPAKEIFPNGANDSYRTTEHAEQASNVNDEYTKGTAAGRKITKRAAAALSSPEDWLKLCRSEKKRRSEQRRRCEIKESYERLRMTLLKIDHEFRIRKDMCNVGVAIGQKTDVDSSAGNVCVTRLELVNQAAFCLERLYRQIIFLEKLLVEKQDSAKVQDCATKGPQLGQEEAFLSGKSHCATFAPLLNEQQTRNLQYTTGSQARVNKTDAALRAIICEESFRREQALRAALLTSSSLRMVEKKRRSAPYRIGAQQTASPSVESCPYSSCLQLRRRRHQLVSNHLFPTPILSQKTNPFETFGRSMRNSSAAVNSSLSSDQVRKSNLACTLHLGHWDPSV